jgi:hypothetical protein
MTQTQTLMLFIVPAVLIAAAVVYYVLGIRKKKSGK